ncbi:uncharacterized protein F4822DRAFT_423458 [Hypoxylon trugodes]|uniref:uncharacterized protein n=1 Tax=Hypoxylon trugodes TaxID=326681 RepID=UPI0021953322|nr:uncharacterized protein F4822DRAFT_423458 [Hypoxylon trugodes]KAI1382581.1 hypothetical protein F4822DRAFT_423458 [Hypoxylon trugodes]
MLLTRYIRLSTENAERWNCDLMQCRSYKDLVSLIQEHGGDDTSRALTLLLSYEHARWWKTGSASIVGEATLGIDPIPHDAQTMPGSVPVPRLIVAQWDTLSTKISDQWAQQLFQCPDGLVYKLLMSQEPTKIHAGYIALRVLVDGSLWVVEDQRRCGKEHSTEGYPVPEAINTIEDGLNELLFVFATSCKKVGFEAIYRELDQTAREYHDKLMTTDADPGYSDASLDWLPSLQKLCETKWKRRNFSKE